MPSSPSSSHQIQTLLTQTKLLTSLVHQSLHHQALSLFLRLHSSSSSLLKYDPYPFPLALKSASSLRLPLLISSLHSLLLKLNHLPNNPFISSSLLSAYSFSPSLARHLFDQIPHPHRTTVVWNSLISLHARSDNPLSALPLFHLMDVPRNASSYNSVLPLLPPSASLSLFRSMDVDPNAITLLALLPSLAHLGALRSIEESHAFSIRRTMHPCLRLCSGLVEVYGRCGSLVYARRVFNGMDARDVVVWSSMVSAYAFHGMAGMAKATLCEMERENVRPDGVMFLGVLKACSHSGMAEAAVEYFGVFRERYGVEAGSDHYSCLVDVLGRAGRLREAYDVVRGMPVKATAKAWGALLGACRNYGEVELAEVAAKELFVIEPENAGNYVLLASTYSRAGRREEADRVRREMVERDVKRRTGSSWVVVQ